MDGGQTTIIPLDSDLDIVAQDMLVPVNAPEFLHNRQKFTGRCLPSSVRFEHDGWAAGHHVYNYALNRHSVNSTPIGLSIAFNILDMLGPVYHIDITDVHGTVIGSLAIIRKSTPNERLQVIDDGDNVHIKGDINGRQVHLVFNSLTREMVQGDTHNTDIAFDSSISNTGRTKIVLHDNGDSTDVDLDAAVLASNGTLSGDTVMFIEYNDNVYRWSGEYVSLSMFNGDLTLVHNSLPDLHAVCRDVQLTDDSVQCVFDVEYSTRMTVLPTFDELSMYFSAKDIFLQYKNYPKSDAITANWKLDHVGVHDNVIYAGSNYLYRISDTDSQELLFNLDIPIWGTIKVNGSTATSVQAKDIVGTSGAYKATVMENSIITVNGMLLSNVMQSSFSYNIDVTWNNVLRNYDDDVSSGSYTATVTFTVGLVPYSIDVAIPYGVLHHLLGRVTDSTFDISCRITDTRTNSLVDNTIITILRSDIEKQLSSATVVLPDDSLCGGLRIGVTDGIIRSVSNIPNYILYCKSHLDYPTDYTDNKIPSDIVSVCRYGSCNLCIRLDVDVTGTVVTDMSRFIRNSVTVEQGMILPDKWYIDRDDYTWFDLKAALTADGNNIGVTLTLRADDVNTLYVYDGGNVNNGVVAIDTAGTQKYHVAPYFCTDVCTVSATLSNNNGLRIGALRNVNLKASDGRSGISAIDNSISDFIDGLKFTPGAYTASLSFTDRLRVNADVDVKQDVTISVPGKNDMVVANSYLITDYAWVADVEGVVSGNAVEAISRIAANDIQYDIVANIAIPFTSMLPHSTDNEFTLVSAVGVNTITVERDDGLSVSYDNGIVVASKNGSVVDVPSEAIMLLDGAVAVKHTYIPEYVHYLYIKQLLRADIDVIGLTTDTLTVSIDGKDYTFDISDGETGLFNPNIHSTMTFNSVDVYDEHIARRDLLTVNTDDVFQFVRQAWDTESSTEVFWYVDSNRYIALTQDKIIRMMRTDDLHDWYGDVWIEDKSWRRLDIIDSGVVQYICSSAYNSTPYLLCIRMLNSNTMSVKYYDTAADDLVANEITVSFNVVALGEKLNVNTVGTRSVTLRSYSSLNVTDIACKATLSATRIDNLLLLGIHYNNNFDQWTVIINLDSGDVSYIQGYGYVGVNGSLTGGEIPARCFDVNAGGFNDVVHNLAILDDGIISTNFKDVDKTRDIVVGTAEQQWYLFKSIDNIVSHILYSNGVFSAEHLPITSAYTGLYVSGSTAGYNYEKWEVRRRSMEEITLNEQDKIQLDMLGGVYMFFSAPVSVVVNYLQQSCIQAAYVHYNSTSIHKSIDITEQKSLAAENGPASDVTEFADDLSTLTSDTLSFDKVKVSQSSHVEIVASTLQSATIESFVLLSTSSVDSFISSELKVNSVANTTLTDRIARQFSAQFTDNLAAAIITSADSKSTNVPLQSEVVAIKSLDMFYSTSDGQKVQAGPGFVNHNFVAQCAVQSVSSIQYESYAKASTVVYPGLTRLAALPGYITTEIALGTAEAMLQAYSSGGLSGSFPGVLVSPMALVAVGTGTLVGSLKGVLTNIRTRLDACISTIEKIAGEGPKSTVIGTTSIKQYDVEGKHKYGSKSEMFMWPCFSCGSHTVRDESVSTVIVEHDVLMPYNFDLPLGPGVRSYGIDSVTHQVNASLSGNTNLLKYRQGQVKGTHIIRSLPDDMAYVIGTESFLPSTAYRNENISESEPTFPMPVIQDYIIDERWSLGLTSPGYGGISWVSCKDTKIIDGAYSNIVVSDNFCGVACAYAAVEVKRGISNKYVRPWAITPQALLFNQSGYNCCADNEVWHACDGQGYRLTSWVGAPGMHKENMSLLYCYVQNERFKLSNKLPPNQFLGNFISEPNTALEAISTKDSVYTLLTQPNRQRGTISGQIGEDKDLIRYSIPIFTEQIALLPAAVKTYSGYTLSVVEGITGLITDLRTDMQGYKIPISEDFTIGAHTYRITSEYICEVKNERGVSVMENLVPTLGLRFLGATPHEAYFYSPATRMYYVYTGGDRLNAVESTERFRELIHGLYDFVGQEVVVPALATFNRLDKYVEDDADETDNVIVPRLRNQKFVGEVWPPLNTIYNTRSWYRLMSLPVGVTYQGPNRCIINQFLVSDYMLSGILHNKGKWQRVPRERYNPFRKYTNIYSTVDVQLGDSVHVKGWTHNPFLLVTSPLGVNQETDCVFEWVITFCWTVEMDKIIGEHEYVCVNVSSETMSPGGKKVAERPTHVFLSKELFTRTGNYGYYSFRFSGQTGAGNRERLHIWSDGFIAISSIELSYKPVTTRRNEILTQQVDVIGRLTEM